MATNGASEDPDFLVREQGQAFAAENLHSRHPWRSGTARMKYRSVRRRARRWHSFANPAIRFASVISGLLPPPLRGAGQTSAS